MECARHVLHDPSSSAPASAMGPPPGPSSSGVDSSPGTPPHKARPTTPLEMEHHEAPLMPPATVTPPPVPQIEIKIGAGETDLHQSAHPCLLNAFLRRVYGILSLQLALTFGISALCMLVPAVRQVCVNHYLVIQLGTLFPCIGVLLLLFAVRKSYPTNLLTLGLFTLLESWSLGAFCAMFAERQAGPAVLAAAGMTLAIVASITVFCMVSRWDFSFLWGGLSSLLLLLMLFGMMIVVFRWRLSWLYALLGAILFSAYILVDTAIIINRMPLDEYIQACVELYLDILNLFMYLVILFAESMAKN